MRLRAREKRLAARLVRAIREFIDEPGLSAATGAGAEDLAARPRSLREALDDGFKDLEQLYEREQEFDGLPTGVSTELDRFLGGFQPGQLAVLAGEFGMRCTALALQIARNAALALGVPTLYFTTECSEASLARRMLLQQAGIDTWKVTGGELTGAEWDALSKAMGTLGGAALYLCGAPAEGVWEIKRRARQFADQLAKEDKPLGLVVVDALTSFGRPAFRDARVLQRLARELKAPVIALWRLDIPPRRDMEPRLEDLAGREVLGFPADKVLMLYRDEAYNVSSPEKGTARLFVHKNQNASTGMMVLHFDRERQRFSDIVAAQTGRVGDRPALPPPDRIYVPCGDMEDLTNRVLELIPRLHPEGFTLDELLEVAGFDDIDAGVVCGVEQSGYQAAWVSGMFLRRVGERWKWVDLDHLGGIFGVPIERAVAVLFEATPEGSRFSWQALATLLGADHAQLVSWGDGAIAGRKWLVKAPAAPGLLGFVFSFGPGRRNSGPPYEYGPLLDVSKHQEGKLLELSKPSLVGRAGEYQQVFPARAVVRREVAALLLSVFGASADDLGPVKLYCRGPHDPVVLVVDGEPRAVMMPELGG